MITSLLIFSCDLDSLLSTSSSDSDSFTLENAIKGLKEALVYCAEETTGKTGSTDGYLQDEIIKILLPDEAQNIYTTLKKNETYINTALALVTSYTDIDDLMGNIVTAINRSAEAAASDEKTLSIFTDAITDLSLNDAFEILKGNVPASATRSGEEITDSPYAATLYLKEQTYESLSTLFTTIIDGVLSDASITGFNISVNDLWGYFTTGVDKYNDLSGWLYSSVSTPPASLSAYVTEKALDGLFYYIGVYEKDVRENFSSLFDLAETIIDAFNWAQEQAGSLTDAYDSINELIP